MSYGNGISNQYEIVDGTLYDTNINLSNCRLSVAMITLHQQRANSIHLTIVITNYETLVLMSSTDHLKP